MVNRNKIEWTKVCVYCSKRTINIKETICEYCKKNPPKVEKLTIDKLGRIRFRSVVN